MDCGQHPNEKMRIGNFKTFVDFAVIYQVSLRRLRDQKKCLENKKILQRQ